MTARRIPCVALLVAATSWPAAGQTASREMFATQVLNGAEAMPTERFDRDRETSQWSRDVYRVKNLNYRIIEPISPASPPIGEVAGRIESANACCFESKAQAAVGLPSPDRAPLVHDFELRFQPDETGWHMASAIVFHRLEDGSRIRTQEFVGRAIRRGQIPAVDGPVGLLAAHIEKHGTKHGIQPSSLSPTAIAVEPAR